MRQVVLTRAPYRVSFHPNMVKAYLLIVRLARGVLEHFLQELHQMLWSNLLTGLPSWVLDSTVLPAWVYLFLQRDDGAS
jgi:hypothetical protein